MGSATLVFIVTGLTGLMLAMTASLSAALPNLLIAAGFTLMFLGLFGAVIGSVVAYGYARQSGRS